MATLDSVSSARNVEPVCLIRETNDSVTAHQTSGLSGRLICVPLTVLLLVVFGSAGWAEEKSNDAPVEEQQPRREEQSSDKTVAEQEAAKDDVADDTAVADAAAGDKELEEPVEKPAGPDGQADLDKATALKVAAKSFDDLGRVVNLCESALRRGLDDDNREFATSLLAATRMDRASRLCHEIFDVRPPNRNWRHLARAALVDLELAISHDKSLAEAYYLVARIRSLPGGNRKRAVESLKNAIALAGDNFGLKADALTLRGELGEDDDKRLSDYNEALRLHPDHVDALRSRGLYFMLKNEHEKALSDFDHALEVEPEHAKTHEMMAVELFMTKDFEKAKQSLDKAIGLARDKKSAASAYVHRARIYAMQEKYKEAVADVDTALEMEASNLQWRLLRAQIHQEAGDAEAALTDVERILVAKPDMVDAIRLQAGLLAASKRVDEAIIQLERAVAVSREAPELLKTLAMFYSAGGKHQQAIETYGKVIKEDPSDWTLYRGRADVLLSVGRQEEAIRDYDTALSLEPENSGILNNLAWVLATTPSEELRDAKRSLKLAKTACEVTEYKAAHILSTLAAAYAENGDFETAIKWSEKSLELGKGEVREQLAKELDSYKKGVPWRELHSEKEDDTVGEEDAENNKQDDQETRKPENRPSESLRL